MICIFSDAFAGRNNPSCVSDSHNQLPHGGMIGKTAIFTLQKQLIGPDSIFF